MDEDVKTLAVFVALDSGQPIKDVLMFIEQAFKYRSVIRLKQVFTKEEIKCLITQ